MRADGGSARYGGTQVGGSFRELLLLRFDEMKLKSTLQVDLAPSGSVMVISSPSREFRLSCAGAEGFKAKLAAVQTSSLLLLVDYWELELRSRTSRV